MIYIWQNLDQGNTKITENNFPILTSASQKKEYSNVFVVFHSMCCLSQATWLSRYIKNIIDNFIFLHCRWKASNQTHVYINTDSYLWYITSHPQKLNIHEQKLLIITLDNLEGYHIYHWRLKIRLFVHFYFVVNHPQILVRKH